MWLLSCKEDEVNEATAEMLHLNACEKPPSQMELLRGFALWCNHQKRYKTHVMQNAQSQVIFRSPILFRTHNNRFLKKENEAFLSTASVCKTMCWLQVIFFSFFSQKAFTNYGETTSESLWHSLSSSTFEKKFYFEYKRLWVPLCLAASNQGSYLPIWQNAFSLEDGLAFQSTMHPRYGFNL